MMIIKSDGSREMFDAEKIKTSILRTGATTHAAQDIAQSVGRQVVEGMTTKEIYSMVHGELSRHNTCFACRYNLRDALLKLGPAGYKFEKYIASVLRAYKYDAYNPPDDLHGSCVDHEVDVVAQRDGRRIFIEAKFRNDFSDSVMLKDVMATWSRFLDLVDGASIGKCEHFDECWIVTNARFSDRAEQFGTCKGIHMIGWNFPEKSPLSKMVDNSALYPVTVLDHLKQSELEALSRHNIMLCRELTEHEPEELAQKINQSRERAEQLISLCSTVVEGVGNQKRP